MLLADYNRLAERKVARADYDAADILLDLQTAIKRAKLTARQAQVLRLIFVLDLTQTDAARRLGIEQQAVGQHLQGAIKRITRVYRGWEYGEVTVHYEDTEAYANDGEIREDHSAKNRGSDRSDEDD